MAHVDGSGNVRENYDRIGDDEVPDAVDQMTFGRGETDTGSRGKSLLRTLRNEEGSHWRFSDLTVA